MKYLVLLSLIAFFGLSLGQQGPLCGSGHCPSSDQCCPDVRLGSVCYDPTLYLCINTRFLCGIQGPNAENVCGGFCFDGGNYVCLGNGNVEFLCGRGLLACGTRNICYDPKNYICSNGFVAQKPGTLQCGGTTCTGTAAQCCGNNCFDANTQVCQNDTAGNLLVCPISNLGKAFGSCNLASGSVCYDRDNFTCCVPGGSNTGVICALGDNVCCAGQPVEQTAVVAPTVAPPVGFTCPQMVITEPVFITQAVTVSNEDDDGGAGACLTVTVFTLALSLIVAM